MMQPHVPATLVLMAASLTAASLLATPRSRAQTADGPSSGLFVAAIDTRSFSNDLTEIKTLKYVFLPAGTPVFRSGETTPTLPVLLPADERLGANVQLLLDRHSYAASSKFDGVSVTVYGTHVLRRRAADDPIKIAAAQEPLARLANGAPYVASVTEYGADISFTRYGAAYMISVECNVKDTDRRCADTEFVRSLAETVGLAVVRN